MTHSKYHLLETSRSFASEWLQAILLFKVRLKKSYPEDKEIFGDKFFREDVDFNCYLVSLTRFKRAIILGYKQIETPSIKNKLEKSIKRFNRKVPVLKMFRDVGEHFDEYILQKGHDKNVNSRGLRVYETSIENGGYTVKWLNHKINIKNITIEAFALYKTFLDCYKQEIVNTK